MRYPNPKFQSYKIALYLYQIGGATKAEAVKHFDSMGAQRVRDAINDMYASDMLIKEGDLYRCKHYLARYFDDCERVNSEPAQIVPPRTAPEFRPLSAKNMAHLAPRREQIREVSFLNGSIGFTHGYFAQ